MAPGWETHTRLSNHRRIVARGLVGSQGLLHLHRVYERGIRTHTERCSVLEGGLIVSLFGVEHVEQRVLKEYFITGFVFLLGLCIKEKDLVNGLEPSEVFLKADKLSNNTPV